MLVPIQSFKTLNLQPSTQNNKKFQEIKVDGITNEETIFIVWFISRIDILNVVQVKWVMIIYVENIAC